MAKQLSRLPLLFLTGCFALTAGCGIFGSGPKTPNPDEEWLTEYEAYEDQTAHTGMDGGAFVTTGLKIRNLSEFCWVEADYTPAKYAISNGAFETLENGEVVYVRYADGLRRSSIWVASGGKYYYMDEKGFLARDAYAIDGFWAGSDGSWDPSIPRKFPD